jgi:hypothetical protein
MNIVLLASLNRKPFGGWAVPRVITRTVPLSAPLGRGTPDAKRMGNHVIRRCKKIFESSRSFFLMYICSLIPSWPVMRGRGCVVLCYMCPEVGSALRLSTAPSFRSCSEYPVGSLEEEQVLVFGRSCPRLLSGREDALS